MLYLLWVVVLLLMVCITVVFLPIISHFLGSKESETAEYKFPRELLDAEYIDLDRKIIYSTKECLIRDTLEHIKYSD